MNVNSIKMARVLHFVKWANGVVNFTPQQMQRNGLFHDLIHLNPIQFNVKVDLYNNNLANFEYSYANF